MPASNIPAQMIVTVEGIKCPPNDKACVKRQLSALNKRIEKRRRNLADMSVPMTKASNFLDQWVQRNFKTEGGKVGGWEPFAAGGRKLPNQGFDTSAKLLQHSGRLKVSFLPFASKTNAGIGSDLPYSEPHNEGIGVPERRMLPEHDEVIGDIRKVMDKHVEINT